MRTGSGLIWVYNNRQASAAQVWTTVGGSIILQAMDYVGLIGKNTIQKFKDSTYALGFMGRILFDSLLFFRKRQVAFKILILQILFTAVEAFGLLTLLAIGIGAIINIMGSSLLPQFGAGQLMYTILIAIISRELGPLLTAFVIAARSGTAIATELGGMVVSHELEAYVSVGIDPVSYLAVPRFLGVTISTFLLNIYFNFFGLLGSYVVLRFAQPLPIEEYLAGLVGAIQGIDIAVSVIKSVVFGAIVSLVATYQGFSVVRASTEVPQAGIRAVTQIFTWLIVGDAIITLVSYLL